LYAKAGQAAVVGKVDRKKVGYAFGQIVNDFPNRPGLFTDRQRNAADFLDPLEHLDVPRNRGLFDVEQVVRFEQRRELH